MSSNAVSAADITTGIFSDTPSRDVAVSVRRVSKVYSIAKNAVKHTTVGEALMYRLSNPFAKIERDLFWALQDVSFDIQKGEVVGIIGRNGAGKSTLLKILSRITEPTKGRIDLYGRVGSLLEVGTGFHPELTGRENIFLNGAILGMKKSEILHQFDAIVDFSGTAQFLDTPVKRYSSGMYVRLAFAVAAHLNPEILIVDEVLAVGDLQFQAKCLGKMQDVAKTGRTVLFVSHSMTSVLQLCSRAIFLDQGSLRMQGAAVEVVNKYLEYGVEQAAEINWREGEAPGSDAVSLHAARILSWDEKVSGDHYISSPIILEMEFSCRRSGVKLNPSFHVNNIHGNCIFAAGNNYDPVWGTKRYEVGRYRARCTIPAHLLNDGQYHVSSFIVKDNVIAAQSLESLAFGVTDDGSMRGDFTGNWIGAVRPILPWSVEEV